MKKEMLINVLQPEECRIAILENGVLEELYVERTSHESYVGNIYKGRIVNIEPSIQAAFVDFGVGRNGFLHVSDVEPAYYRHLEQQPPQRRNGGNGRGGRGGRDRDRGNDRGQGQDRGRGRRARPQDRPPQPRVRSRELEMLEEDERELARLDDDGGGFKGLEELVGGPPSPGDRTPAEPGEAMNDTTIEPEPEPEPSSSVVEEVAPVEPPAEEEPPTPPSRGRKDADAPKDRRRSRGGSRRRGSAADKAAETPSPEPASDNPPSPPEATDDDPPRPRLMDSAERRTDEDDEPRREPLISDEDLFFPRSEQEPTLPRVDEGPDDEPVSEQLDFPIEEPEEEESFARSDLDEPSDEPAPTMDPAPRAGDEFDDDLNAPEGGDPRLTDDFDDEYGEGPRRPQGRDRGDRGGDRGGDRRGGPRRRLGGRPGMGRPKPLIQDIFKRGQEVLVQVIKEGIGTKGPTLSTYISIAGRYLVLMPGLNRVGVSRKIMDEDERRRLRTVMDELQPPKGLGFVIRTSAQDRTKKELYRDLAYLSRLWQVVVRRIRKVKSPAEIYQESDMITRTIRDIFTSEIENIWVDETNAFEHAQEFLQVVMPRFANRIKHYQETAPIFHKHGIEEEIARIQLKKVPLSAGGSIVIEQTEALVAIDVNSGNFRADNNAEETAYQMNLQAAKEIARQLRLRDLGGVIVNDFIDMRDEKHRRGVERAIREAVKRDRARTKILRMSQFGIIEMTRQRIRPSLKRSVYSECSHCHGSGSIKTTESMSLEVMRLLQLAAHREHVQRVEIKVTEEVASYLLNRKRKEVTKLEEEGEILVQVTGVPGAAPEMLEFLCLDNNNNEVKFTPYQEERPQPRRR